MKVENLQKLGPKVRNNMGKLSKTERENVLAKLRKVKEEIALEEQKDQRLESLLLDGSQSKPPNAARDESRRQMIYEKAPDLKCPWCHRGPLPLQQFVVNREKNTVCCRGCSKRQPELMMTKPTETEPFYQQVDLRYYIKKGALARVRLHARVSQTQLAALCGWGRKKIRLIEEEGQLLNEAEMNRLLSSLRRLNVTIID